MDERSDVGDGWLEHALARWEWEGGHTAPGAERHAAPGVEKRTATRGREETSQSRRVVHRSDGH
jgi:hypothetical protein